MEIYDPKSETWDTLPNPPIYTELVDDFIYTHLVLEGKNYILVNRPSLGGESMKDWLITYDVTKWSWNHLLVHESFFFLRWIEYFPSKRRQQVGTTLYWIDQLPESNDEIDLYGFDISLGVWTQRALKIQPILTAEREHFMQTGLVLLYLHDLKFYLLLVTCHKYDHYLHCIILDLNCGARLSILSIQKYLLECIGLDLLDCMLM